MKAFIGKYIDHFQLEKKSRLSNRNKKEEIECAVLKITVSFTL
jgi:hypothetical protein